METLLRAALMRSNVSTASLTRVIEVTSQIYRKAAAAPGADVLPSNPILQTMFETVSEAVRMKARVTPATLTALFKAMTSTVVDDFVKGRSTSLIDDAVNRLAIEALVFLQGDAYLDSSSQTLFDASQAAAKLLLNVAEFQPDIMARLKQSPAALRFWNNLVLAALQNSRMASATLVFEYFSIFTLAYSHCLGAYHQPQQLLSVDSTGSAQTDVSGAYLSIKLWLLLVRRAAERHRERLGEQGRAGSQHDTEVLTMKMVWNELWPPFERVMTVLEADTHAGNISPLASTMWTSVADLILFLRQARIIALDVSTENTMINRLRTVVRGESKLLRVTRSIAEPPPNVPFEFFVNQVATEIQAEEKLHAAKRHDTAPEKGRRIVS